MASCQEVNTPFGVFCHVVLNPTEDEAKDGQVATSNKTPPHVIIVMDKSGSMSGPRIKNAQQAVVQLIKSIQDTCSVNVISFESIASVCRDGSKVIKYVEGLTAGGGTCFTNAFQEVVKCMDTTGDTIIVLVTDGETDEDDVIKSVDILCTKMNKVKGVVQCHSLGISNEATISLLQKLAEAGTVTGTVQHVSNAARIKECLETLTDIILYEKIVSVTTSDGVRVVNEVVKGSMPQGILVNKVPVAVTKLPPTDLYLLSGVNNETSFNVILSAIQSIAREAQESDSDDEKTETDCKTAEKLIESLNLLDEQKTELRDTIRDVRDGVTAKKEAQAAESKAAARGLAMGFSNLQSDEAECDEEECDYFGGSSSPGFGSQADSSRRDAARFFAGVMYKAKKRVRKEKQ